MTRYAPSSSVYRKKSSTALSRRRSGWKEGLVSSSNFFFIAFAASLRSSALHVSGNLALILSIMSSASILAKKNRRFFFGVTLIVNRPSCSSWVSPSPDTSRSRLGRANIVTARSVSATRTTQTVPRSQLLCDEIFRKESKTNFLLGENSDLFLPSQQNILTTSAVPVRDIVETFVAVTSGIMGSAGARDGRTGVRSREPAFASRVSPRDDRNP